MKHFIDNIRITTSLALIMLGSLTGACVSDSPPTTGPELGHLYQPFPRDYCARLPVENLVAGFDLTLPSRYEPSDHYFVRRTYWETSCGFSTMSQSDRFATAVTRFEPAGSVLFTVFRNPADAQNEYRMGTRGFEMRRKPLGATLGVAEGWWDEGEYSESVRDRTLDRDDEPDVLVSTITVSYIVYHENLYLEASLDAGSDPAAVEDATAVLHDMVRALLDEAVAHLTLSE